jgi:hypothetical protein
LKKYFEIKETNAAGNSDTARIIILYHPEVFGYLLYSPSVHQILKANLWEGAIHPDGFPAIVQTIKQSLPVSVHVESATILTFPDAEIMLPGEIYDADYIHKWMELSFGKDPDVVYITENKGDNDVVVVKAINKQNRDTLLAEFSDVSFHSLRTSFFQRISGDHDEIRVLFYGRNIYVALYHQRTLQCLNSFPFHTPEDVLYVLLNLCDKYQINKENLTIISEGFIDPESSVIQLLDQYFLHIQWPDNTTERTYIMPQEIPAQTAQLLERIISCVS